MDSIIVRKQDDPIYSAESSRLASQVHSRLLVLKAKPTVEGLRGFSLNMQRILSGAIYRVSYSGYSNGAKMVEQPLDATISQRLRREANARGTQAALWIAATSADAFDIQLQGAMSKKSAMSPQRADKIAVNELSLAFFGGTRYGWGLDPTARKTWHLSSRHDVDDTCDDNADEGPISINDAFQSGHFIPPAHICCECELGLVRVRNVKRRYIY